MIRHPLPKLALFIGSFFLMLNSWSQANDSTRNEAVIMSEFAYIGNGFGGQRNAFNLGFYAQFSNKYACLFSFENTNKVKVDRGFLRDPSSKEPQIKSTSISILLARMKRKDWGHYHFSAGPAFSSIKHFDKYNEVINAFEPRGTNTWGLALNSGVFFGQKFLGVGVIGFLNINPEFVYGGVTANFALGWVNY
jgi:hypothetical protein